MTEAGYAVQRSSPIALPLRRASSRRLLTAAALWAIGGGNAALIVWLWVHGGNVSDVHSTGELLTSIGRLTGLLAAYAALLQVVLLARLHWLERLVGFDRLTVWHRWNGHACLDLVLAHVVLSVWGYALMDKISLPKEISTMLGGGIYPGMITATIGTALLIAVVVSSVVIVRRRLRYEAWYAVHLAAYAGIALAWFHQIPTGNELAYDHLAADYWRALYVATLGLIVGFRVLAPLAKSFRHRLRVAEVVHETPGVVTVQISGRALDRLNARAGQFFLWRFLDRKRWWSSHPFSLSAAPDGRSLRITVKALGDFTGSLHGLAPGTRVIAEGPFGVFTEAARKREKVLLVAGGIGITPIRALMEDMRGDVVVIYRVVDESDIVFREELEQLAGERGVTLHFVVGDHATRAGRRLLSPRHLRELVPDISDRQVYVCGPPAMTEALERNVRRAEVPARFIHTEKFAPLAKGPDAKSNHDLVDQPGARTASRRHGCGRDQGEGRHPQVLRVDVRGRPLWLGQGRHHGQEDDQGEEGHAPDHGRFGARVPEQQRPFGVHQRERDPDPAERGAARPERQHRPRLRCDRPQRGVHQLAAVRDPEGEAGMTVVEHVMGMPIVVDVRDEDVDAADVGRMFAWLRWVDATFSTYREDSEICRLDRGQLSLTEAHEDVQWVFARCETLREETDGYFDAHASGRLDPSGFVKGWSIDRAAELLRDAGLENFALSAGGDIRLVGRDWRVGVQHPSERHSVAAVLDLNDGAVATSAAYARGDHVLDPHTGRPPADVLSVTFVGPELATADAYATAAFAMGARGPEWTAQLPGYEAMTIMADETVLTTGGFPDV